MRLSKPPRTGKYFRKLLISSRALMHPRVEVAGSHVLCANVDRRRDIRAADVHDMLAAWVKATAGRRINQVGIMPGMPSQAAAAHIFLRHRCDQAAGVRVLRVLEEFAHGRLFDNATGIHDRDAFTAAGDHAQIVRDQQHGQAKLRYQ